MSEKFPSHSTPLNGFEGGENIEKIEQLKQGPMKVFLDEVSEIRNHRETLDQIKKQLEDLDQKKDMQGLRTFGAAKLFAVIGKKISFGKDGISITCDFGNLKFAEEKAVGAGHILPSCIRKISFTEKVSRIPIEATRTVGNFGAGYVNEKEYQATYGNTEIFIDYEDIITDTKQATQLDTEEKRQYEQKKVKTGLQNLKEEVKEEKKEPETDKASETNENLISKKPVFIGDSQMEGMARYLRQKGINTIDFNSMKMENIAAALKNPAAVDAFYSHTKKSSEFAKQRKEFLTSGLAALKTADSVVLQCGGNNIIQGWNLERMKASLQQLMQTIKDINPNIKIHVGLLLPMGKNAKNLATREAYNEWLRTEASRGNMHIVDSYGIIDTYRKFKPGRSEKTPRHLPPDEYKHLAAEALKTINYQA